mgnify:CR=1 FL=1
MQKELKYILIIAAIFAALLILMFVDSLFFVRFGAYAVYFITLIFSIAVFFVCKFLFKKLGFKSAAGMNTEFVSMVAHELKTSLSAVKWSLKMLLQGDFGQISKEQTDVVSRLYKKNDSAISRLCDLLDLAKIEDGEFVYDKKPADIEDIMRVAVDDYRDEVRRKNIKLNFFKPEYGLPKLSLDREKIKSAIENILDNSAKYTPPGGTIDISLAKREKEIEIIIEDSGIGIKKSQQAKIFNKFFRGDNATSLESDGTGLGLFIAKNVIRAHNGKIWFKSEENKGTAFYITLPVVE